MSNPQERDKASLSDIINYKAELYITEEDQALIRDTFKGNERLIKLLRKVLLPTMADSNLPVEEFGKDMWFAGREWSQIPAEEAKILICAREEVIKFICGGLINLKQIANITEESPQAKALRMKKDSAK